MASRARWGEPESYDSDVFINCPFDDVYRPIFRGLTFAVIACGLRARCAQEVSDAGEARIQKIARIIRECRWGIHDISRTELNASNLPRFNMPLELGLFLGARWFGAGGQKRKSCLVLDREPYRFQQYISDIAGQDIAAHQDDADNAIHAVRDWLTTNRAGISHPPGGPAIGERFRRFVAALPAICASTEQHPDRQTFTEYADAASTWLRLDVATPRP